MLDRITEATLPLIDHPHPGPVADDGARGWRVPVTPFILFYDVGYDAIEVVTIRHARCDWARH